MAPPVMTPEQRAEALAKAAEVRKERAALKHNLKAGGLTLAEVLARSDTDVVGKMKVADVIGALPGMGKIRTAQVMGSLGIAGNRRVRGLTAAQREKLTAQFEKLPA